MQDDGTPTPVADRLRAENALLRDEFVRLFIEEQELLHIVRPNLERIHRVTVGAWELRLAEADLQVRVLRRRIAEVQSALRAGGPIDLAGIDDRLDRAFAESRQRIRTLAAGVAAAERTLENLMNDDDEAEFKGLYRDLVAGLHPVLAPQAMEEARTLWERVGDAYARHSSRELRALALLARAVAPPARLTDAVALQHEQARLTEGLQDLMRRIAALRQRPPFTLEQRLADPAWIAARRDELNAEAAMLETQAGALEVRLARLLPAVGQSPRFGPN